MIRWFFTWLAIFGVFTGMQSRALGADPCDVLVSMHEDGHSDHDHGHGHPCDSSHDENCPLDHHHHGNCGNCMPMAAELHAQARLGGFGFSLSPIRVESESPPDGPFTDLDKPPLI